MEDPGTQTTDGPYSSLAVSVNHRPQELISRLPAPPFPPAGIPVADLVPEGDLSCVPPGDPRGEEPLHVPQEHYPIHSVVFAVCLLERTETVGEPGSSTCRELNGVVVPQETHVLIRECCECPDLNKMILV